MGCKLQCFKKLKILGTLTLWCIITGFSGCDYSSEFNIANDSNADVFAILNTDNTPKEDLCGNGKLIKANSTATFSIVNQEWKDLVDDAGKARIYVFNNNYAKRMGSNLSADSMTQYLEYNSHQLDSLNWLVHIQIDSISM